MQELSKVDFFQLFDAEVHEALERSVARYGSEYLVAFENHDLGHRELGHRFAIGIGPQNTLTTLPDATKSSPVAPPNGRMAWRYYPVAYCRV